MQYLHTLQSTVSNKSTVRLLFLGSKWSHCLLLIWYCAFIVFEKVKPPCAIIKSCAFIKFGLFLSKFFFLFHQYFLNFSPFYVNFIHLDTETQKPPCLINFGYTSKNYTVHLFHWCLSTLCVHSIVCVYSNWRGSSTLCIYSIPCFYLIL